jgi:hypothetical protein
MTWLYRWPEFTRDPANGIGPKWIDGDHTYFATTASRTMNVNCSYPTLPADIRKITSNVCTSGTTVDEWLQVFELSVRSENITPAGYRLSLIGQASATHEQSSPHRLVASPTIKVDLYTRL